MRDVGRDIERQCQLSLGQESSGATWAGAHYDRWGIDVGWPGGVLVDRARYSNGFADLQAIGVGNAVPVGSIDFLVALLGAQKLFGDF